MSKNIKAVLFDLDGTLRLNVPNSVDVFADCLKGMGVDASQEDHIRAERWEHFYFANSLEIKEDSKTYKDDEKGFWVNFSKRRLIALGLDNDKARELAPHISDCMEANYKPQSRLPDGIQILLQKLQEKGYVLGVVSNRDEPFHEELESLGLKDYFEFTLAGGEVDSFKPDPGIFEHALKLAKTSAHEAVYVGDNYFADVVGAHRAGLTPVLYDPGRLFPEAECEVIRSFDELHGLLIV